MQNEKKHQSDNKPFPLPDLPEKSASDNNAVHGDALLDALARTHGSHNMMISLLEAIGDAISIQDRNFKVLYQNRVHRELVGDHIGELCYSAYNSRDTFCPDCPVVRTFQDGKIHTVEKNGPSEKGILRVEITSSALTNESGEVVAGIEVVRDITERWKAQEELRLAEAKFRSLVEQAVAGIYILQDDRFVYANPKFAEILGYSQDELTALPSFLEAIAEKDREMVSRTVKRRLNNEISSTPYSLTCIRKNGEHVEVEVQGTRIEYNGKVAVLGIMVDISERRKAEAEKKRAEHIEAISELAGTIAHEFNNVLTAIVGNIAIAKMYAKPGYEVFDVLMEAEKAALRAKDLTLQLLTFSDDETIIKSLVDFRAMLQGMSEEARQNDRVAVDLHVPDDLWSVEADEALVRQSLFNLIENAREAMPSGGTVTIIAENLVVLKDSVLPLSEGDYIKIDVTDYGNGISEKNMGSIFDPFFTTKDKSAGLGLTTAYSIIRKHGGNIKVASVPGVHTTFTIYLPAVREKKGLELPADSRSEDEIGRVLVMDDEESVRAVAGRMLNQCGYEVEFARNGNEMLRLYLEEKKSGRPFDMVIIDLVIADGMGGKDAIRALLDSDPDAKAIVSSGYSNDPVMSNYREYGFKAFLPKPYRLSDLHRVLHEVAGSRK